MSTSSSQFEGKKIALGICGSIAAYRACDFVRELYRQGASRVMVMMTDTATEFVSPLTFHSLSREPVITNELAMDDISPNPDGTPMHVKIAQEADALVIMPATQNTLSKLAQGLSGDIISTTFMTFTDKPVVIAPAMNTRMWEHPLFKKNLDTLTSLENVSVVTPTSGLLACGETGDGHLAEQDTILMALYKALHPHQNLYKHQKALVTAGGTQEAIDPVRFISNRSSGKMGVSMADELWAMGADVTLIATNAVDKAMLRHKPYKIVSVESAEAMQNQVLARSDDQHVIVMAAAVSDYACKDVQEQKIKRDKNNSEAVMSLELTSNPDILAELGQRKTDKQLTAQKLIGFAAESENLIENAKAKLEAKNLTAIVANDISRNDIGFDSADNEVVVLHRDEAQQEGYQTIAMSKTSKATIARQVLLLISNKNDTSNTQATNTDSPPAWAFYS